MPIYYYLSIFGRKNMIEDAEIENDSDDWKKFLKKHWNMLAFWITAAILATIGAVLVFLWFVGDAQSTSLIPMLLAQWTINHLITFILHLLFWELILIGIPVAIAAIIGWLWWKKIPDVERDQYHFFGKRSRTENGGSGISFLFFVVFCIKVYIDGNWNIPIATWTLDYVVDSTITILFWSAIVFGIPALIIGLIYLSRQK